MSSQDDVREFLATRRAKITPQQAGVASYGRRRVPGVRREEVAMLAGVSTDYYARLERGNLVGVSDSVLDASARALKLDEAETTYLYDLTRAANAAPRAARRRHAPPRLIRPSVQKILDGMTDVPAMVLNGRLDLLATSKLGAALYSPIYADPTRPLNLARFCFLDAQATALYPHWDEAANTTVAILRTEAGRDPYNRDLSDLIGELCTRSEIFRNRWASHNVRLHRTGSKVFQHPAVGRLVLNFEVMGLSADTGLALTAYTAADATSQDGLTLLASWAATQSQDEQRHDVPVASQENTSEPT
jgi:transcriptional regulator with XRE-family HTH domain